MRYEWQYPSDYRAQYNRTRVSNCMAYLRNKALSDCTHIGIVFTSSCVPLILSAYVVSCVLLRLRMGVHCIKVAMYAEFQSRDVFCVYIV